MRWRAADAGVLNIAEGNGKGTNRDYRKSLETALREIKEAGTGLLLAEDGGIPVDPSYEVLEAQRDEACATLYGLLRSVNQRIENGELERRKPPGKRQGA